VCTLPGVRQSEFEAMLALDEHHWWYRGRRRVLAAVLDRIPLPGAGQTNVLDAGCGSGRTLDDLARRGLAHGMELNPLGFEAARRRGHEVREGRVEAIPYGDESFDLVTCLDVIEHTDDDTAALAELRRVTKPRGRLVLSVPAHPRLWSRHDEVNGHRRRYTRRTLTSAAATAGWRVERLTGFNVAYLAPAALVRIVRRTTPEEEAGASELTLTPPLLNPALELPLRVESALVKRGFDLPPGLSLMAVLEVVPQEEGHIRKSGDDMAPHPP
jgi:SAM-dependent methyltransferase